MIGSALCFCRIVVLSLFCGCGCVTPEENLFLCAGPPLPSFSLPHVTCTQLGNGRSHKLFSLLRDCTQHKFRRRM